MSLRTKLIASFCGPLAILLAVSLISFRTVTLSSKTIERIFSENYDSVAACLRMKTAIERMNRSAEGLLWGSVGDGGNRIESAMAEFTENLRFQQRNVTLSGERELNERLAQRWGRYRSDLEEFLDRKGSLEDRRGLYRGRLLPEADEVLDSAQDIIDINLNNMVSADGQVRRQAMETIRTLIFLVVSGVLSALVFAAVVGPAIVRPISRLTRSARDIQQGNLDLFVKVRSGDEIGQLASAFNEMTARLRQFRRADRARFTRTRNATVAALNSLADAIVLCDPAGEVELANDAARHLFGVKPGENIQSAGNEKIVELVARVRREMRPVRPKGHEAAVQVFTDGEERFFLPQAIPILDEDRGLAGVTLVLTDVTRLREIDAVKSGLIATVSHELKTPLTSIRLATHALLSEKLGPLTPRQVEIVAAAREDSDRLSRIVENLLEIGRIQAGRSKMELLPVNTEQVLFHAAEKMRARFLDRGITLDLDVPGDVPKVLADRFRLEIVFTNLLGNALKFTPPGGRVEMSARAGEGLVRFAVEDSGSGIPEEYLPHVFDKFFRVPGSEQQRDSGLGLAIVKEIVEAHGGRIEAASKPGQGTRFTFFLKAEAGGEKLPEAAGEA